MDKEEMKAGIAVLAVVLGVIMVIALIISAIRYKIADEREKAYQHDAKAAAAGISPQANPHLCCNQDYAVAWLDGYMSAPVVDK